MKAPIRSHLRQCARGLVLRLALTGRLRWSHALPLLNRLGAAL